MYSCMFHAKEFYASLRNSFLKRKEEPDLTSRESKAAFLRNINMAGCNSMVISTKLVCGSVRVMEGFNNMILYL